MIVTLRRDASNTRGFLIAAGMAILGSFLAVTTADAANRPNVILVMTDDQGYGDVAAHGNRVIQTPALDRLHATSVRLTDYHVWPLCTPTRAALLTGQNAVRLGAWGTTWGRSLPRADAMTIADVFSAAGYRTGCFGKWHVGDNYPYRPKDRGFDEVLIHGGGGVGQTPDYWGNDYFDDTYFHNDKPVKFTGYCTDIWFDGAMRFIEASKDKPFFAYVSTNAPHGPYNVAKEYSDRYAGNPAVPHAAFYGMITNIDDNMARLMRKLDELGIAEETILIFTTDNGTSAGFRGGKGFNAGMRGAKGSLYDGGHRVPFFIRWPGGGLTGGHDINVLASCMDVLPTLIDLCGLKRPEGFRTDGVSWAQVLPAKRDVEQARSLVIQYRQSAEPPQQWNAAVLSPRWRLIGGKALYDIKADPGQKTDVAAEHPEVVQQLRATYEKWWAEVSPSFGDYCHIVLGDDAENPARLNCFDWHTHTPWNQGAVRGGSTANSFWAVEIAKAGQYDISLRRWPVEVDAPITAAIPGGKAVRATTARLKIGPIDETRPIPAGAKEMTFTVELPAGKTTLQTWLIDEASGQSRGAYYVVVERK